MAESLRIGLDIILIILNSAVLISVIKVMKNDK
jgi:hypothetical protein